MVVASSKVTGGIIRVHGGTQATPGFLSLYILGDIYTSPEPLSSPFGSAPSRLKLSPSSLPGCFRVPGPPRSRAQAKVPPRHCLLANSSF